MHGRSDSVYISVNKRSTKADSVRSSLWAADWWGDFAQRWRLEFVHPEPARTKSHCVIFGVELLAEEPRWSSCPVSSCTAGSSRSILASCLMGASRPRRTALAGASLYGLTPAGMLSPGLCPTDKLFLWKVVVQPALMYGCVAAPLSSTDAAERSATQAASVKTQDRLGSPTPRPPLGAACRCRHMPCTRDGPGSGFCHAVPAPPVSGPPLGHGVSIPGVETPRILATSGHCACASLQIVSNAGDRCIERCAG